MAGAFTLSLSFPLTLTACFASHSRATTDKHPASALFLAKELFNQLLNTPFWLTRSFKSNLLSAKTILTPLEPVILIERLPTWFHVRTSAPNRLNIQQGPILLKKPPAFYHGLKWNSGVEN